MRVLVIEDDPALQRFLTKGLQADGNTTHNASDGEAALRVATEGFDLVLLDLGLPKRDGIDVLRELRTKNELLPILVLTGRDSLEERLACFSLGADDFLRKPFSFQELLARCKALHRRSSSSAASLLSSGALRLDRMRRVVTYSGVSVDLTGKEFALLEYLMLQRGRCVTRKELLSEVWKMSPEAGTNLVDVYINYVRRKLEGGGGSAAEAAIETVRGQGYCVPCGPALHADLYTGEDRPAPLLNPIGSSLELVAEGAA